MQQLQQQPQHNANGRDNKGAFIHGDHSRLVELYIESIANKRCQFKGRQCDSWANYQAGKCDSNNEEVMGIDAKSPNDPSTRMNVYLVTNEEKPFCVESGK